MAVPKVFTLIKSMDDDELPEIEKVVESQKRASLKNLLKLIIKTDINVIEKLDKEFAFKQVFGKKYSAEQDYLWRHELRLLMDIAEEYAAKKMMQEEWKSSTTMKSKYFMKYLMAKNLYPLVLSEAEQIKKTATAEYDFKTVIDTGMLLFPYLDNHAWNNMEAQAAAEANNENLFDAVSRQYLQSYKRIQIAYYGSKLFRYMENFKPVVPEPGLSQYFSEYEDAYTAFLALRLQTIELPSSIDPAVYRRCLDHLDKYPDIPNAVRERFMLLNNLSAYYFFRYDYEQALQYNEEQIKIVDGVDKGFAVLLFYNYASSLAHLGRYDEALDVIKKQKALIKQFPNQVERFKYVESLSYALKGDKVNFNKSLPKRFDELSKMMQQHYRFMIAISHFIDGEYTLAITEANNIERGIKALKSDRLSYHDGAQVASEHLGIFFDIYQKHQLDGNKPRTRKRIAELETLIDTFVKGQPMSGGLLFYMWMQQQLAAWKEKIS